MIEAPLPAVDLRRRLDQRSALPVAEGDHGRQEEAPGDAQREPISASPTARAPRCSSSPRRPRRRAARGSRTRADPPPSRSWSSSSSGRSSSDGRHPGLRRAARGRLHPGLARASLQRPAPSPARSACRSTRSSADRVSTRPPALRSAGTASRASCCATTRRSRRASRSRRSTRSRASSSDGGYELILFGASVLASDIAAGLSARLDAGLIVDAIELHDENGRIVTRRPGLGDSVLGHCTVPEGIAVIVARANAFAATEPTAATAEVAKASVAVQDWSTAARVVGHEEAETGRRRHHRRRRPRRRREGPRLCGRLPPLRGRSLERWAARSRQRAPSSTAAGTPTQPRSGRRVRPSARSCTSPAASPARSSTRSA